MGALIKMERRKFGRLLVLRRHSKNSDKRPVYECRCDCGKQTLVLGKLLRNGHTSSCGCYGREARIKSLTKHAACKTPTYQSWTSMRYRCLNPGYHAYPEYGGRGITICKRWSDFRAFLKDMGKRPSLDYTLDRINVNKGYSPSNCRWADKKTQTRNRRMMIRLTHHGKTQTLIEWSEELRLPITTLQMRYARGRSTSDILDTPKRIPTRVKFMGQLMTYPQIAKIVGMSYITLRWRLRKGWPLSKAIAG